MVTEYTDNPETYKGYLNEIIQRRFAKIGLSNVIHIGKLATQRNDKDITRQLYLGVTTDDKEQLIITETGSVTTRPWQITLMYFEDRRDLFLHKKTDYQFKLANGELIGKNICVEKYMRNPGFIEPESTVHISTQKFDQLNPERRRNRYDNFQLERASLRRLAAKLLKDFQAAYPQHEFKTGPFSAICALLLKTAQQDIANRPIQLDVVESHQLADAPPIKPTPLQEILLKASPAATLQPASVPPKRLMRKPAKPRLKPLPPAPLENTEPTQRLIPPKTSIADSRFTTDSDGLMAIELTSSKIKQRISFKDYKIAKLEFYFIREGVEQLYKTTHYEYSFAKGSDRVILTESPANGDAASAVLTIENFTRQVSAIINDVAEAAKKSSAADGEIGRRIKTATLQLSR